MNCSVAGESLVLLAEKAVFWPSARTLFIADFHLGKAASFRKAGIALPPGTTAENVDRLGRAIDKTHATRVVFLGDFLHNADSKAVATLARFGEWRAARTSLDLTLIRGNHDRKAGDPPPEWAVHCAEPGAAAGPFVLNHEPGAARTGYALAGHIHPAVRLTGEGESMKLPCFWFGARCGVLPAFGAFTGTAEVLPRKGDQVFVVADDEVIRVG